MPGKEQKERKSRIIFLCELTRGRAPVWSPVRVRPAVAALFIFCSLKPIPTRGSQHEHDDFVFHKRNHSERINCRGRYNYEKMDYGTR